MPLIPSEWRRILPLVLIMAVVAMTVGGMSLIVLYQTAFDEAKSRLTDTAQSRARMIEAIARFDQIHSHSYPGGPYHATLTQVEEAHDNYKGFGETGEFALAKRQGNEIIFVLRHRHTVLDGSKSVPFQHDEDHDHIAEPMRHALLGHSGTMVGLDYRGVTVLAAYEPVDVLNFGVVAKIDLAEIRRPFIRAAIILFTLSVVIIGLGIVVFSYVSEPMVATLMESEALRHSRLKLMQAQSIIREKAIYLDNILSSAMDTSIVATDENFLIRYYNPTAEKLFGYTKEQILGRSVLEVHEWEEVDPSDFQKGLERIAVVGSHLYQVQREVGGSIRTLESRASSILDEEGKLVGYVLMSKDITERKEAEDSLVKSERKYRLLMEYANDAIFVADTRTGIILDANKAAANLLGRSVDEIIGMHQSRLHPAGREQEYKAFFQNQIQYGSGVLTDVVVVHQDGRLIPVEIRAGVTDLGDKQVIQGIFRDVTQRKRAEDALRESQSRLFKAQRIARLGNWDWDIVNNTLYWSDEIYRIFGLDPSQCQASYAGFIEAIHCDDRERVSQAVKEAIVDPKVSYDIQHRVVRPGGALRTVREQGEVIRNEKGQAIRMMGTVHDMTELKEVEEKLKDLNANLESRVIERTHQLEAANRELEAFSYSVAHDLRAPLNNILGFSKILLDEHHDKLGKEGGEYLHWLDASGKQMTRRIADYLKLARSTRVALRHEKVNLSELFAHAAHLIQQLHPETLTVSMEITPNLMVHGDKDLLTVVAENLLSNALKFTCKEEKGVIHFGVNKQGGDRAYYVRDNGIGFDDNYANRLFEPFESLHDPGISDGSGIGLTTVQRIIHRHEGKIWAESTLGEGATFYFTIGK
ncbi:MAG: PAS domain S-box protein [Magnetococcales bacterium]|nr:PAS domain S-box protein [Magnetococcales bacterium]